MACAPDLTLHPHPAAVAVVKVSEATQGIYLKLYIKSHSFPLTGSRASETGSELSQSHSVSSLDPDDEERLRQVSTAGVFTFTYLDSNSE